MWLRVSILHTCSKKSLNLKPGANTITFSLSTTGVAACTARIFVWDYTDLVVISDIDGTITKWAFHNYEEQAETNTVLLGLTHWDMSSL